MTNPKSRLERHGSTWRLWNPTRDCYETFRTKRDALETASAIAQNDPGIAGDFFRRGRINAEQYLELT